MVCTTAPDTGFHTRCTEKFSRSRNAAIVAANVFAGSFSVECHTTRGSRPLQAPPSIRASLRLAPGRNRSAIGGSPLVGRGLVRFEVFCGWFELCWMASDEFRICHGPLLPEPRAYKGFLTSPGLDITVALPSLAATEYQRNRRGQSCIGPVAWLLVPERHPRQQQRHRQCHGPWRVRLGDLLGGTR